MAWKLRPGLDMRVFSSMFECLGTARFEEDPGRELDYGHNKKVKSDEGRNDDDDAYGQREKWIIGVR